MDIINVYAKDASGGGYYRKDVIGVMTEIRAMEPGSVRIFSHDYTEACRTACSILRRKEGMNVWVKVAPFEGEKVMKVEKFEVED